MLICQRHQSILSFLSIAAMACTGWHVCELHCQTLYTEPWPLPTGWHYAPCALPYFHCDTYTLGYILLRPHSFRDCNIHKSFGKTPTHDIVRRPQECKDESTISKFFNNLSSCNFVPVKSKQHSTKEPLNNFI
jgi:hypothetical protein